DIEDLSPLLRRRLDAAQHEHGRVVDQDIDLAEGPRRLVGHATDTVLVGNIGPHKQRLAPAVSDAAHRLLSCYLIALRDDDSSPCLGEQLAGGAADAGAATRDDRDLVPESVHKFLALMEKTADAPARWAGSSAERGHLRQRDRGKRRGNRVGDSLRPALDRALSWGGRGEIFPAARSLLSLLSSISTQGTNGRRGGSPRRAAGSLLRLPAPAPPTAARPAPPWQAGRVGRRAAHPSAHPPAQPP